MYKQLAVKCTCYVFLQSVGECDWPTVNKKLREYGLPAVKIQHPAEVQHVSGKIYTLEISLIQKWNVFMNQGIVLIQHLEKIS